MRGNGSEVGRAERPVLVLMVGAPGTGKSFLARKLVSRLGAELVQTDTIRKRRFPHPRYTPAEHATVYRLAYQTVRRLLAERKSVAFDATNLIESKRKTVYAMAGEANAHLLIVWTYAAESVVAERMLGRAAGQDPTDLSDADWKIYLRFRDQGDPIRRPHFLINTAVSLDRSLERMLATLA